MSGTSNLALMLNETSFIGLIQTQNEIMSYALGMIIYFMIVLVLFFALKMNNNSIGSSFMATGITGFILSLILRAMNLISDWFLYANIVMIALIGIILVFNKK